MKLSLFKFKPRQDNLKVLLQNTENELVIKTKNKKQVQQLHIRRILHHLTMTKP